jgi:D-ribose pyranose/furanose isomerase RbsD
MGWFSDPLFGERKRISLDKIAEFQKPTQDLIDERLDISEEMRDPNSALNMQMRNLMTQNQAQMQQTTASQMQKQAAMGGMSQGQLMSQMRQSQNEAMGDLNQQFNQGMMGRYNQGLDLMGGVMQQQQSLNENMANAYVQNINAANAARNQNMGITMSVLGGAADVAGDVLGALPT